MKKVFGKIHTKAAGVTFEKRQSFLWNIHHKEKEEKQMLTILRREPSNPHDTKAIAVFVKTDTRCLKIGYVPAEKAKWLSRRMDEGGIVRAYHGKTRTDGRTIGFAFDIVYEV